MNEKKILQIIDQTIADTNYVKDDRIPYYNIKKIITRWLIFYVVSNIIIFIFQTLGNYLNIIFTSWFFPLIRILNLSLFSLSLIFYFYNIYKTKISVKEKDFLMLYTVVPVLLIFTKVLMPLSYYLNTDILIGLINTISLDLITLILSAFLIKYYFKESSFNFFILYNLFIYLINIAIIYLFTSVLIQSTILIKIYNFIILCQDYGVFILAHYILMISLIKRFSKNEKYN